MNNIDQNNHDVVKDENEQCEVCGEFAEVFEFDFYSESFSPATGYDQTNGSTHIMCEKCSESFDPDDSSNFYRD